MNIKKKKHNSFVKNMIRRKERQRKRLEK